MSTQDAPILVSIAVRTSFTSITHNIYAHQNGDGTYDTDTSDIQGRIQTHMRRLLRLGVTEVTNDGRTITYVPGTQIQKMTATVYEQAPAVVSDGDSGIPARDVILPMPEPVFIPAREEVIATH